MESTQNKAVDKTKSAKGGSPQKGGQSGTASKKMGPKGNILSIWLRLLSYLSAYKGSAILLGLGFLASTLLSLLPAWLVKLALDNYLMPETVGKLYLIAAAMVGAAIMQGAVDFVSRMYAAKRGQHIVYTIRQDVFRHLLSQSFSYFDHTRTGDIMARITEDANTLHMFFDSALVYIISHSLFLIGILAVLFSWNITMALLYLCILPFIVHGMTRYTFRVRPAYQSIRRILGSLTTKLQEYMQAIQVIKLFGRERTVHAQFNGINEQYYTVNVQAGRITAFWMPYVFVIMGMGTGVLMWLGGRAVIAGSITLGTLVGFSTYIAMMMRPIRQTGMLLSQALNAAAAAERIFEVLDKQPDVRDIEGAQKMPRAKGDIRYENISFSYDKQRPVIQDVSFSIKRGETIAIVGPTGAGKSTLVHLLPRFYDADSGRITIDGNDIKGFTIESLRQNIGIVMQNTFLFHTSIRENIAMGKADATMEQIQSAAKAAIIHDFIASLPNGYETVVGERGIMLSGGQRQRVCIARTLLMDPMILIMDEPTSGLDAQTDERIQQAIANLSRGRTVLIIAHRLWTLKNADRILVLNKGRVEQFDSHEALLSQDGLYKTLYELQNAGKRGGLFTGQEETEEEVRA